MAGLQGFFYRYLASRMIISIISNAFTVFFLWKIVENYHSVFLAGMIATISLAVSIVSSIPIGHLIDRMNSTLLSLISSAISFAGLLFLIFGSGLNLIYVAAGFIAFSFTMKGDSFSAIIKKHLSENEFLKGNSITQASSFVSVLSGTTLGGLAIIYFSHSLILILLILAVISAISSAPIKEAPSRDLGGSAVKELASAMGFYKKIIGFIAVAFVLNGLFESLDVYSSGLFHLVLRASPIYYTAFVAILSVGGIAGSVLASRLKNRTTNSKVLSILVLCYAPLFIILGISNSPLYDVIVGFIIGVLLSVINVPLQTKLMRIVPKNIYGKVMAFLRVFLSGATPAMAAVLSFIAIFLRVDTIFIYIGLIMFPVAAMSFIVLPRFLKLESEDTSVQTAL